MNGKPFPQLFIWKGILDGAEIKKVVSYVNEGKQRIETIKGFVNNEYSVPSKSFEPVLTFDSTCNVYFKDLHEDIQADILDTKITMVEMGNMTQAGARDHFIAGGENVKPLKRPEILNAYTDSHVHRLCYRELPNTAAFDGLGIQDKRFGHKEQYAFLFQMVTTRFGTASPAKHLTDLFDRYLLEDFTIEAFDDLEQVKRIKELVHNIKAVKNFMVKPKAIKVEELHLLATYLYHIDPIPSHLPALAGWYDQFLMEEKSARKSNSIVWTPWFSLPAKTFQSIPGLNARLNFMKDHYRKWSETANKLQ